MSWIKVILDERMCEISKLTDAILDSENEELIEEWENVSGLTFDYDHESLFEVCTDDEFDKILEIGKEIKNKLPSFDKN